ncbi:valine--tRNA ligase [Parasteatoda tepidariorum]|uniref:valine--tRNA ligase n=1 Tax=Parasteatoda tepidariorum TaxID=114398 RepID=UPI00077FCEC3|nr:valine--tRNA ligase [Parasteatoda tepidariorum]
METMVFARLAKRLSVSSKYLTCSLNNVFHSSFQIIPLRCSSEGQYKNEVKKPPSKNFTSSYPPAYDPKEVEQNWYEWWEQNQLFIPESECAATKRKDYTIVLPPPNVTGNLHIGHTLTVTIQDCIARWHRMRGESVLWVPGYDHGGIATQTVVEKKLLLERKLSRQEIGRKAFIEEINSWKNVTQKNIETQLKLLGASLDFRKCLFTMDENSSRAVNKVFIQLFEENLIYRKEKLVNWSCELKSVISDIEVDHIEVLGKTRIRIPSLKDPIHLGLMDYFYYPVLDSDEKILIATTRLETMLGDSAIAVNPDDKRYSHLIGKFIRHPYTEENLPIIADESINKEFGTGVMKVTPAHDFQDFDLGLKHKLKFTDVFEDNGTVSADIENFKGKHRLVVRELLRKSLLAKGLYQEAKAHTTMIPFCSRTGDIVEPRLKEQWYLDCSEMGRKALEFVKDGKLNFVPEHQEKVWNEWFKNLKDWCISRQLWWGHQIPAYKVSPKSNPEEKVYWVAATDKNEAIQKASQKYNLESLSLEAVQDNDVLDTWFSSALYPLTSLGWPSQESQLQKLYPLNLMETGFDILFFWVARMVMLCHHISGKLPFHEVLLHGMVCDSQGRKMTKSLGNTIDPLDVIYGVSLEDLLQRVQNNQDSLSPEELKSVVSGYKQHFPNGIPECGTDGLRFSLLSHDIQNQRINIDVKSIRICRHFCNKIWQGFRLFTKAIEECPKEHLTPLSSEEVHSLKESDIDRWILSRLAGLVYVANSNFESYNFHVVASAIRQFWVQGFCDVYIEYVKSVLQENDERRLFLCRVMLTCIETFLKVISPMMPFLSEELYQRLAAITSIKPNFSVTTASYPNLDEFAGWRNTVLEANVLTVIDLIEGCRSLKSRHAVTKMTPAVVITTNEENTLNALSPFGSFITTLAKLESVTFHLSKEEFISQPSQDTWVCQTCDHGITLLMDIGEKVDIKSNTVDKLSKIRKELDKLNKMLSDSGYKKKASPHVREKTMAKKASLESELQRLSTFYGKSETEKKKDSSFS